MPLFVLKQKQVFLLYRVETSQTYVTPLVPQLSLQAGLKRLHNVDYVCACKQLGNNLHMYQYFRVVKRYLLDR